MLAKLIYYLVSREMSLPWTQNRLWASILPLRQHRSIQQALYIKWAIFCSIIVDTFRITVVSIVSFPLFIKPVILG